MFGQVGGQGPWELFRRDRAAAHGGAAGEGGGAECGLAERWGLLPRYCLVLTLTSTKVLSGTHTYFYQGPVWYSQ